MGIYNIGISGLDIVTQIDVFIVFKGYFNTHEHTERVYSHKSKTRNQRVPESISMNKTLSDGLPLKEGLFSSVGFSVQHVPSGRHVDQTCRGSLATTCRIDARNSARSMNRPPIGHNCCRGTCICPYPLSCGSRL